MRIEKKIQKAEQGRSMIEIIGVLAIVGVLSVVGIIGFMRGMDKYKSDKVLDQTANIHHNLQELYNKQDTYKGLAGASDTETTNTAIALDVFPENMVQAGEGNTKIVRHAGGGNVVINSTDDHVTVTFYGLSKETAISLATSDFDAGSVTINSAAGE